MSDRRERGAYQGAAAARSDRRSRSRRESGGGAAGLGQQKERSGVEAGTRKGMEARKKKTEKRKEPLARLREEQQQQREACALAPGERGERRRTVVAGSSAARSPYGGATRCAALLCSRLGSCCFTWRTLLIRRIGSEGSGICSFSENFRGFIPRNDTLACTAA